MGGTNINQRGHNRMSIPITYIRSSSYGSHEMCEMKYFGEYALGHKGLSNRAADKGTIVHKVMEILAEWKHCHQRGETYFNDDILGQCFISENLDDDLTIDGETYCLDDIIEEVYNYYTTAFDHHIWGAVEFKDCVNWCYKAIEDCNGQYNPFNQNIVKAEQHFDFEMKGDWADYEYLLDGEVVKGKLRIKGTVDLVTKIDDNTHEMVDYKTGARKNWATDEEYTYENLPHNFQLRLYHYAHMILYPEIENVLMTIYYINTGGPYTIPFSRSDIPETIDMIREKFEYIKSTSIPKPNYTWKCKKFCQFGKNTFEGTNVKPLKAGSNAKWAKPGETMCQCEQMLFTLQNRPMDVILNNMTAEGHSVSKYQAPGEAG